MGEGLRKQVGQVEVCGLGPRRPQVMCRNPLLGNHSNRTTDRRELYRQTPVYHQV